MRRLAILLFSALMLSLGARAQQGAVELNFAGIDLVENDRGWKVEETGHSFLPNSPLETGDIILKIGGQDVAPLGPLSAVALLEYAQGIDLGVVVERAGQEKEVSFRPAGSEGGRETFALGAIFRSVEDTQRILVSDILPGSPAEHAGLKKDDELLLVGGKAAGEMALTQLADILSNAGDAGERLRVRRGGHALDITLKPVYSGQSSKSLEAQKMPFPLHARGEPAPSFSLPDLTGRKVALSDFRGKPVVVAFWGAWCRLCVAEADIFNKLHQEMGSRLVILGLDIDDEPEVLQNFLQTRPLSYPVLIAGDFSSPTPKTYDLGALPLTLVINPDGYVIYLQTGLLPGGPLESRVRSLVAQTRN